MTVTFFGHRIIGREIEAFLEKAIRQLVDMNDVDDLLESVAE